MHLNNVMYLRCSLASKNPALQQRDSFTLLSGCLTPGISTAQFTYAVHRLAKTKHFNSVVYLRSQLAGQNQAFQHRNLLTLFIGWQNHAFQQRNLFTLHIGWQKPCISTA